MMCSPPFPTLQFLSASSAGCVLGRTFSERVAVGLAGPDAHRVVDRRDENLAIADLAGARALRNDVDHLVGNVGIDGDLDAQLGQEVHDIFGAAVNLGVAFLPAIALDLGYRHAVDADGS